MSLTFGEDSCGNFTFGEHDNNDSENVRESAGGPGGHSFLGATHFYSIVYACSMTIDNFGVWMSSVAFCGV
jgi:hypothetical protein